MGLKMPTMNSQRFLVPVKHQDGMIRCPICPVCEKQIPGDEADAVVHVDDCLKGLQAKSIVKPVALDDEVTVNVEDADDSQYGRPQYTEQDVAAVLSTISNSFSPEPHQLVFRRDSIPALLQTVHLQDQIIQRIPRCLICLEPHRKPVVSAVCWHVFCESCWLQTIASKRVCPHCSSITSPEDLRRIYL